MKYDVELRDVELRYIRQRIPHEELLAALAEEATELAQAALKFRRAMDGTNPTPEDPFPCLDNLQEEIRDVIVCAAAANLLAPEDPVWRYMPGYKLKRWCERLEKSYASKDTD